MKVLIIGKTGQAGCALAATVPACTEVTVIGRAELDIRDPLRIAAVVGAEKYHVVINAAAYTAVDRAETVPDEAYRVNRDGAGHIAAAAAKAGARVVHLSTDFVFDGASSVPYPESHPVAPLSTYGASKAAGEAAVRAAAPDALILRTAWLYAAGHANFVNTMLRVMASGQQVRVVADQIGTPTHAIALARAIWTLIRMDAQGTMHFTDAGIASWYDFAHAIGEIAKNRGLLDARPDIRPIGTKDYRTAARRPAYSVLDKAAAWAILGAPARHWREELDAMLAITQRAGA